jgi:hypothetical protein
VPRWTEIKLPAGLDKPEDLEAEIFLEARKAGVPADQPFPFLLRGTALKVKLHVVNKTDNAPHSPEEDAKVNRDDRGRVLGPGDGVCADEAGRSIFRMERGPSGKGPHYNESLEPT